MRIKILLLLLPLASFAQVVVSAPAIETMQASELKEAMATAAESAKQTVELKKSYDVLKEAADALEKVTSVLYDATTTYRIVELQANLITYSETLLKRTKELRGMDPNTVALYSKHITRIVENAHKEIRLMRDLLTTGIFKMNDSERLQSLDAIYGSMKEEVQKLNSIDRDLNRINTLYYYSSIHNR